MLHIMELLTSQIILYILIALAVLFILMLIWNIRLEKRITKFMHGKDAKSLEESFILMRKDITNLDAFRTELEKYLKVVDTKLAQSIRGFETINYNAFAGAESGGKSFAIALLNERGDGVIISTLHARERISLFAKKIVAYKSQIELSGEELDALTKAKNSCSM